MKIHAFWHTSLLLLTMYCSWLFPFFTFWPKVKKWRSHCPCSSLFSSQNSDLASNTSCRVMVSFKQFFLQHFLFFVSSMFSIDNIFLFLETLLCRSDISHPPLLVSMDSTISCVFIGKKRCSVTLDKDCLLRNECSGKKCNFLPGGLRRNCCPCC